MSATSKTKIPGYTGFVPSIKSENVHGSTYGKTTKSSQMGTVLKGMNQPAAERFKSTSQASYGTQPTEAMLFPFMDPIDGIVAPADDGGVPFGMHAKFHGVTPDDDDTFKKDAETFFGDGTKYRGRGIEINFN